MFHNYWLSHVIVKIETYLFFGDLWISFGCFLPGSYPNNITSNLFHLILLENIDFVCACVCVCVCVCVCTHVSVFEFKSVVGFSVWAWV